MALQSINLNLLSRYNTIEEVPPFNEIANFDDWGSREVCGFLLTGGIRNGHSFRHVFTTDQFKEVSKLLYAMNAIRQAPFYHRNTHPLYLKYFTVNSAYSKFVVPAGYIQNATVMIHVIKNDGSFIPITLRS